MEYKDCPVCKEGEIPVEWEEPHICLFDRSCWRDWWEFGMPMRIYYSYRQKFITIWPFTGKWITKWRWEREPVELSDPKDKK